MDTETREWLQERIDGRVAVGIGVGWLAAYEIAVALEPVTHQPEPWYGVALGVMFLGLVALTATGLVMQRRWGLVASVAAGGFFTALSVACPVSGHHPFGAWWFGQMACALGILGASAVVLTRTMHTGAEHTDAPALVDAPADVPVDAPAPAEGGLVSAGDGASRG